MFLGKGAVFSYDPIGCLERVKYQSSGHGECLLQPFLDKQLGGVDRALPSVDQAISILKDGFSFLSRISSESLF